MNIPHSTLKILYTQGLDAQNPPLFLYLHAKLLISQAVHQPHSLKTINQKQILYIVKLQFNNKQNQSKT